MQNDTYYGNMVTNDAEKTARFLAHVFGWQINYDQSPNQKRIKIGKDSAGFNGGIFTLENTSPLYLTVYIRVEDIEAKVKEIVKHGGCIIEPPFEKSDGSQMCYFNEPSGIPLTIMQKEESEQIV